MGIRRSQTAGRVDPGQAQSRVEAASVLSIIDVCQDPDLFGPWFKGPTWTAWFVFLRVLFGLPLDEAGLQLFRTCTGRSAPSLLGYLEVSLIIGRRGGKSLILALIAAYLACFFDWRPFLTGGERASVVIIAADRRQATVIFKYLRAFLSVPLLRGMIERETADTLELSNSISIEIQTASYRTIRGRTVVAALCDELAFWMGEDSANPDTEIVAALKPAMATIPRALLLKASSPYSRRGVLWNDHRRHFAKDESAPLVWQADTRAMNPSVPQSFIDAAYEDDPSNAAAEYGAQFRTDVEAFVTREAAEACVIADRFELPPMAGVHTKLISQLCALERRTWRGGRDSIDHPPNQHDDVVNAVAGVLTNLIVVEAPQPYFGMQSTSAPASAIGGWAGNGGRTPGQPDSAVYAATSEGFRQMLWDLGGQK